MFMIRLTFVSLCILSFILFPSRIAWVEDQVRVVVTFPILQGFVESIGKDRVKVTHLSPTHAKPSSLENAHLMVRIGLGSEQWVDNLVKKSKNPTLQIVNSSDGIPLLKDVSIPSKKKTDSFKKRNTMANTHIWLDPVNAKMMLKHIAEGLSRVDPQGKKAYFANLATYIKRLDQIEKDGKILAKQLKDRRIVAFNTAWPYFARRFGFSIEEHQLGNTGKADRDKWDRLSERIKKRGIKVLVSGPMPDSILPGQVALKSGSKLVVLASLPGAVPGTETYPDMLQYNLNQLITALEEPSS